MIANAQRSTIAALVALATLLCCLCATVGFESYLRADQKNHVLQDAEKIVRLINQQLTEELSAASSLAVLLQQGNGTINNFDAIARQIIAREPGISALQLAPQGVIEKIYPLSGNEKALGLNLLTDEKNRTEALLAQKNRKMVIAGPFDLRQGGKAFVGRLPVYLGDGDTQFWGFASVLIRLPGFLDRLKLQSLQEQGYSYALWRMPQAGAARDTFAQSGTDLVSDPVIVPVDLSNGTWFLGLAPQHGWSSLSRELIEVTISLLLALLAGRIDYVQRRARDTLRKSERQQKRLFIEIPAIMQLIDRQGVITDVSDMWLRTLGYERNEVIGRPATDFLCRMSPTSSIGLMSPELFCTGSRVALECQYRCKDGRELDMQVSGTGLLDDSGTVGFSMLVLTDITQEKNAEARLTESLNFNETVLLKSPLPKGVYRASGPCVMANQAYAELVSATREQLLAQNFRQIKAFRDSGLYDDCMAALVDGQLRQREIRTTSSFGKEVWADCMILPTLLNNEPHLVLQFVDLTELHQQRGELQTTLDRLHTLLDLSSDGIHVLDEDGNVVEFSQSFARMLGYSPHEAAQLNVVDWDVSAAPEKLRAGIRRRLGSPADTFETRHRKKDGTVIDIEVSCKGITLAGRDLVYASSRDITERKRGETALRNSEERFRRLIDHMPESILEVDERGIIVLANARTAPLFGYEIEELLGQSIDILVPEKFQAGHGGLREEYCERPSARLMGKSRYVSGLRRDGQEFPVEIALVPFFDSESRHVIVTATDISERRQAEQQLALFRNMIETAGDPFYMADLDDEGRMVFVNEAAARHFGVARAEIYEWRLPDWDAQISYDDLPQYIDRLQREDAIVLQTWHRVSEGREVPVEISVNRYVDGNGRNFAFGWFKDVSRRLEIERLQREATEKAQAASRAKSDFLANMSHEIRTPMSAVLGLSQLLLDMQLQPEEKNYMIKLHNAARSLLGILNDILDYSKIEAGKLDLENAEFDLNDLLDETAELFCTAAEEKGIELVFDVDPNLGAGLLGDALRMKQIINNLLGNAIKFTRSGHVRLAIRELHNDGAQVTLALSVTDSGIGMTAEQLGKLFNAFQQADTSTTRKFGGTGLGLAIVKRLAGLMRGTIVADSEPGKGSTFTLTVTLDLAAIREPMHKAGSLHGMRALIIEDQEVVSEVLAKLMTGWTFDVDVVTNGEQGLELVNAANADEMPYGLVLVDWKLPGMDGIEFTRRLRKLEQLRSGPPRHTVVVMATAYGRSEASRAAENTQFDAILDKPFLASQLYDLLVDLQKGDGGQKNVMQWNELRKNRERMLAFRGANVLLVEDNLTNQLVARSILNKMGLVVSVANNGVEAIALATEKRYAVILMDLQMPTMGGLEATERIRLLPGGHDVPIIAMTAAVMPDDRLACHKAGMNDFVSKPIDVTELTSALIHWIGSSATAQQLVLETNDVANDSPFRIAGLELEPAARRLGDNWALLRRILESFLRDFSTAPTDLDTLLATKNMDELARLIHTIKGLAQTIGAVQLHEVARQFETELREHNLERAPTFRHALTSTLESIAADMAHRSALQSDVVSIQPDARMAPLLCEILDILGRSGFVWPELLDELSRLANQSTLPLVLKMKSQINAFNYPGAKATMMELARQSEIRLEEGSI